MQNQINKAKEGHQHGEREKWSPIFKKLSALLGFPGGSDGKESACNAETWFHPWVRKIPWEGTVCPLQYSCLGYPRDRGAWQAWPSVYRQSMVSFSAALLNMERTRIPILIHTQSFQNYLNYRRVTFQKLELKQKFITKLFPPSPQVSAPEGEREGLDLACGVPRCHCKVWGRLLACFACLVVLLLLKDLFSLRQNLGL